MAQPDLGKRHRGLGHRESCRPSDPPSSGPSRSVGKSRLGDSSPLVGMTVLKRSPATGDGPPPQAETAHRGIVTMARTG